MSETEFARAQRLWSATCRLTEQVKERDAKIAELERKLEIAKKTLLQLKTWGYSTQFAAIDDALFELGVKESEALK